MSIENNQSDFEKALSEMEDTIEKLDWCVDEGLMNTLKDVVNEYDNHYKSDIEELMDKVDALLSENEELRTTGVA